MYPQDGFVLELHINWPTRELFVALNRGPYQAVPDLRLPDDVSTLRPWVHANGAHNCLVELVKVEQLEAGPPPDRKVRLSALLATPHSHGSDSEERSDPPTVKAQRQAPHGCAQTVAHGRRKRVSREAEAILSREENARQFETEMQEVEEELGEEETEEIEETEAHRPRQGASRTEPPHPAWSPLPMSQK